jgi:hypothetical protein
MTNPNQAGDDCDYDEWDGSDDQHGYDCDCDECKYERAEEDCGQLPAHLGGGCTKAGSEECDLECPFRDEVLFGGDDDDDGC